MSFHGAAQEREERKAGKERRELRTNISKFLATQKASRGAQIPNPYASGAHKSSRSLKVERGKERTSMAKITKDELARLEARAAKAKAKRDIAKNAISPPPIPPPLPQAKAKRDIVKPAISPSAKTEAELEEEDYQAYLAYEAQKVEKKPVPVSKYEQEKNAVFAKSTAVNKAKKAKKALIEQGKQDLLLDVTIDEIPIRFNLSSSIPFCCVTVSISCDEPVFHEDEYNSPLGKYMHAFADQWKSFILDPTSGTSIAARISSVNWATDNGLLNMSCVCAGNFTATRTVAKLMIRGIKPVRANALPAECKESTTIRGRGKQIVAYPRHLIEQIEDTLFVTISGRNVFKASKLDSKALTAKIRDAFGKVTKPKFILPNASSARVVTERVDGRYALKVPAGLAGYWTYLLAKPSHPGLAFSQGTLYSTVLLEKNKLGSSKISRDDALKRVLAKMGAFHNKLGGSNGVRFRALTEGWAPSRREAESEGRPAKDNVLPAIAAIYS